MSEALRQIIAYFGFEADTKPLEEAQKKVTSLKEGLTGLGQAIAGAFVIGKVAKFAQETEKASLNVIAQANRLGVSVEEFQKWSYVAEGAQVTANEFALSMRYLNKSIGMALTGNKEAIKTFGDLKVKLKDSNDKARPAIEVMQDMADAMKDMDVPTRTALSMKTFLSTGQQMLPVMSKGSENLRQLTRDFDQLDIAMEDEYQTALHKLLPINTKLNRSWQVMRERIHKRLLPAETLLKKMAIGLTQTFKRLDIHTYMTSTALAALGTVAGVTAVAGMMKFAQSIGWVSKSLSALGKLRAFSLLLVKVALLALVAFGLYLVFDSIFTLMKGGKSVVGDLLDKFYGAGTAQKFAEGLRDVWKQIQEVIVAAKPVVEDVIYALGWALKNVVVPALSAAAFLVAKLVSGLAVMGLGLSEVMKKLTGGNKTYEKFFGNTSKLADTVARTSSSIGDKAFDLGEKMYMKEGFAPPSSYGQGGGRGAVSLQQSNKIEVNVNAPNANPVQVANQVGKAVSKSLDNQHAIEALNQVGR